MPPVLSVLVLLVALGTAADRAFRRPAPRAVSVVAVGANPTLPSDARAFWAAKREGAGVAPLVRACLHAGRQPSAVVVAEALARGLSTVDVAAPLGADGAAILDGAFPPASAWAEPGRAGFAALMAVRSARVDLIPELESLVREPPSTPDLAAGRFALSRLQR